MPLRPLTLGEIYDGAFGAIRHNPAVMLGVATLVILVATVVGVLVGQLFVPAFAGWFDATLDPAGDPDAVDLAMTGLFGDEMTQLMATTGGIALTSLLATPVVNGILTVSVSRSVIGDKASVSQVWDRVRSRVWLLVLFSLLQALLLPLVLLAVVLAVVALTWAAAQASAGLAVAVAVLGALGLAVVALWLSVRLGLVPPALALEGQGLWATVRRAWVLTRGSFWRLFGIYLLSYVIVSIVASIVTSPLSFVLGALMTQAGPTALVAVTTLATVIQTLVMLIFLAGVVALLYIDVRMRREGLDVQLAAAAAERPAERQG
ncbi:hypothetical protein DNL40_05700 [Xylanimonas oleitrophica]|uniref:DUF7847 domain-containing protein n=1 Tax=Xylanimonas oleitrophica TaxID=2607479 RepID=A0A2W5WTA6_9MICO|nr:hypothetical protein DNL40_05700 [Xylanimonas oleitrophica]